MGKTESCQATRYCKCLHQHGWERMTPTSPTLLNYRKDDHVATLLHTSKGWLLYLDTKPRILVRSVAHLEALLNVK